KGAVQVPDPFLKRVLFEATTVVLAWLRERGVPVGFKDLGAGGISCAAVEMAAAAGMGLDLDLDRESVDDPARAAEVIACAETQERFALIVPAAAVDSVLSIYNEDFELPALYPGAGARDVGRILDDDRFVLRHRGAVVCDLPASVVTAGIAYERAAAPPAPRAAAPVPPGAGDDLEVDGLEETLGRMLARPNLCSRAFIYRGYDGEVRGRAVVRPGEGDAGVIAPVPGAPFGLAMTVDGIPAYGQVDPYLAGAHAACEAMRNVVCAGAEPIALTDCLNYGNPEVPEVFGTFVAGVDGIADAARGIGRRHDASAPVPVVSGNVSFYNQSTKGRAVAPSPIVACAGRLRELTAATTLRIRRPGSALLLVGRRRPELGGSEIAEALWGRRDAPLPPLDFAGERRRLYAVLDLIESGAVLACHDIAAGGFLLALVEMLLGERATAALGARIEVDVARWLERPAGGRWSPPAARPLAATLFGEAPGYLLEIDAGRREAVREHLAGRGIAVDGPDGEAIWCGSVTETAQLEIDLDGRRVTVALEPLAATLAGSLAAALA
ncbi:MAG: AIR synthase-related protein, partial [Candidatus Eiseniibacteriota bacterium]